MTPTDRLTHALPKDPADDGPTGIADSADLRTALAELAEYRLAANVLARIGTGPA